MPIVDTAALNPSALELALSLAGPAWVTSLQPQAWVGTGNPAGWTAELLSPAWSLTILPPALFGPGPALPVGYSGMVYGKTPYGG